MLQPVYKFLFHLAIFCQTLLAVGFLCGLQGVTFRVCMVFSAIISLTVALAELYMPRDDPKPDVVCFLLHYGTYLLVAYCVTDWLFEESAVERSIMPFRQEFLNRPALTASLFVLSFLLYDLCSWIVHAFFHRAPRLQILPFALCHLTHHSMTKMGLTSVRHNGFGVFFALVPNVLIIGLMQSCEGLVSSAILAGILAQTILNVTLTPFQHADFESNVANVFKIAVGHFHTQHHDDSTQGFLHNYSVGVFSFWDNLFGTNAPRGAVNYDVKGPEAASSFKSKYGLLGARFYGKSDNWHRAFFLSQAGPVKEFLLTRFRPARRTRMSDPPQV